MDLICIGAPKTGTSWLFKCLEEHPRVCTSDGKEPHFFSLHYSADLTEYHKLFQHCPGDQIRFEASTSYFSHPEAAQRISKHVPDAKIILIVRDPVERAYSEFLHAFFKKKLPKNITLQETTNTYPGIIENSLYGKHLSRFLEYFSKEQILVISYSNLEKDPQKVIDAVCDFAEIDTFTPSLLTQRYNSIATRSHPLYRKIVRTYLRLRKKYMGRYIIAFLKLLGINASKIELLLEKTTRKKRLLRTDEKVWLEEKFQKDQAVFNALFEKNRS